MKNALISPNELVYSYDGTLIGERIAEVELQPFGVAPPLYWIECQDNVNANEWYFQTETSSCELIPVEPPVELTYEEKLALVIAERDNRLIASDWTQLADVIASHDSVWLDAWNTYRQELRDMPSTINEQNIDNVVWAIPPN
jgi:hypothetical protein